MEEKHLEFFRDLLGPERVSVNPADLEAHSQDESFHPPHPPDVVVWPENAIQKRWLSYAIVVAAKPKRKLPKS